MITRAMLIAAAALGAGGAAAQGIGSMEVRLSGGDRTFVILGEEEGTDLQGSTDLREVVLVAVPDAGSELTDPPDPEGQARLTLAFAVEGLQEDASVSEPRIAFQDEDGQTYALTEGSTATVSLTSFSEIGDSFVLSGEFASELVPEGGDGEVLGVSGTFQATLRGD